MASKAGKKRVSRAPTTSGAKKATQAGKKTEVEGAEGSVQEALALTQAQIEQSLQEIRREMATFQAQVMDAVRTVHSEQAQGLARVRKAMEGALRISSRPGGEPVRRAPATGEEEPEDDEPVDVTVEPLRAVGEGVENIRLAVGQTARAIDEGVPTTELHRAIQEGVASVERAVQEAVRPEVDAMREGVESVRAAVAGESADAPSGVGETHAGGREGVDETGRAVQAMREQIAGLAGA